MLYFLLLFSALGAFWLLLSGHWHHQLLLALGAASALLAAWVGVRMERRDTGAYSLGMLLRLPRYLAWLVAAIVRANIDVVNRIWYPDTHPIHPVAGRLPSSQGTDLGKTIYANSITLTPGTVAIEIGDDDVFVHALTREGFDELAAGEMDRRVTWAEGGRR
ncbi:MAG: cation transporter [Gammaproteobacteria bacterium]|nr:cation transporter [Gammaproteobacteria bacterium]